MRYICKRAMPFNGTGYDVDQIIEEGDIEPGRVRALLRMGVIVDAGTAPALKPPDEPTVADAAVELQPADAEPEQQAATDQSPVDVGSEQQAANNQPTEPAQAGTAEGEGASQPAGKKRGKEA